MDTLNTPVLIFIFNRPHTTQKAFEQIAKAQPTQLLIVADGPRHEEDMRLCQKTRSIVENNITWSCEVLTNYSDKNLGVIQRQLTGLNWAFSICEEAIILEDDCVPHPTFFHYCQKLLNKYRNDPRIMLISGQSVIPNGMIEDSYFLSQFALIWGWATWRDSWKLYESNLHLWPYLRETSWLLDLLKNPVEVEYWRKSFNRTMDGCVGTWDYKWMYTFFLRNGLAVVPRANLVSNIGFGQGAANTTDPNAENANLPTFEMNFPLIHPKEVKQNQQADRYTAERIWISRYKERGYQVTDGISIWK